MELVEEQSNLITKDHLVALYTMISKQGNDKQAQNIIDLYEKFQKQELVISFAGHFSAGKSSIINELLGKSLLPQSPIPTSANLVKITSGDDGYARVYFHHEKPVEYAEPYDIDLIKDYCKDKDAIKKIEINASDSILPRSTAVMDTPGIDAADDADRLMTEGSLHLVDVMFYVMDYNHVQSEVNLEFLRAIQEKNIPFFLIVNQIDKHNEDELPFSTYTNKIKQTFNQWGIMADQIFYTSLLDPNVPHNQLSELKSFLSNLVTDKKESYYSIERSIAQISADHKHYVSNQYTEEIDLIKTDLDVPNSETEHLVKLDEQLNELEVLPEKIDKDFIQTINSTLDNAYIMPATLRDKAKSYLESEQPDFKVGLLGSKKKTEQEKKNRLHLFLEPLQENLEKSIQWKLRDKLIELMKSYEISDSELTQKAQSIFVNYTSENLESLINPGAKVNGESVLNYTNDVKNDIKNKFKREAISLKEVVLLNINKKIKERMKLLEVERNKLQEAEEVTNQIITLENERNETLAKIDYIVEHPIATNEEWNVFKRELDQRNAITQQQAPLFTKEKEKNEKVNKNDSMRENQKNYQVDNVSLDIKETIDTIESIPGFEQILRDLTNKQKKLDNRSFTITLFGAFSAGKSSFANALLGESVLPVSPNPTTATINRIVPVSEDHPHGSVIVTMKKEETLIQDILTLLKGFTPSSESIEGLFNWLSNTDISSMSKMHFNYLQAFMEGYETMKDIIGGMVDTNIDTFTSYVTDETKACFVESIDLYYDCSLTKQGITLVDTPGADSVNARHTNVAFEYIKHADAILYVTYYNHALSRADKDFLMQLGRVKESFELDKMFFIINAADLAKDADELLLVENYVNEQLLQLGIRFPKLFPISSRETIANKEAKEPLNNKMVDFEEQFFQFIHHDLLKLSIESALWDIRRAYNSISAYVESVSMSVDEKQKRKQKLQANKETAIQEIQGLDENSYKQGINQKIDKQLYYVLDRLSIRFHDMFKEMFNPATIQESGKAGRIQINECMQELLDYVGYELLQELRAVSLRIESLIRSQVKEMENVLEEKVNNIDTNFSLPNDIDFELLSPNLEKAFTHLTTEAFAKALSLFKNPKSFFEKNEKEQMKEAIYAILKPYAESYIEINKQVITDEYSVQLDRTMKIAKDSYVTSIDTYVEGLVKILTQSEDKTALLSRQNTLKTIINNYEIIK